MKYGWLPSRPDYRDQLFAFHAPDDILAAIPKRIDLSTLFDREVYNQGNLSTCTANAACALVEFVKEAKQLEKSFNPSRLFNYYCSGLLEGTQDMDCGRYNRDAFKAIQRWGVCREETWPYESDKWSTNPSEESYIEAEKNQAIVYRSVRQTSNQIRGRLSMGFPVSFGFTVFEGFESDSVRKTGIVDMPKDNEGTCGGHAVLAVGYDDDKEMVLVRNSWGREWGLDGHFWMPYAYIFNPGLSSDFWTIELME